MSRVYTEKLLRPAMATLFSYISEFFHQIDDWRISVAASPFDIPGQVEASANVEKLGMIENWINQSGIYVGKDGHEAFGWAIPALTYHRVDLSERVNGVRYNTEWVPPQAWFFDIPSALIESAALPQFPQIRKKALGPFNNVMSVRVNTHRLGHSGPKPELNE